MASEPATEDDELLVEFTPEIEFVLAASHGELDLVKEVTAGGVDVNATDVDGSTALLAASFKGHEDVVQFLLAHGADVILAQEKLGWTPLVAAAYGGHTSIARLLLAAGASIDHVDPEVSGSGEWQWRFAHRE